MRLNLTRLPMLLCVLLCVVGISSAQSESQRLNAQLVEYFRKGDLDAAVPIAERVVEIEKEAAKAGSSRNLTNALENLGQIKLERFKRSMLELRDPTLGKEQANSIVTVLRKDAVDAEVHFQEAIKMSSHSNEDIDQAINLRSKLAWLTYNYIPAEANPTFGFDKDSRDKLELRQRSVHTRRFEDSRKLYSEAKTIADKSGVAAVALSANFNLAEFEVAMGNLEAAVPLFESIIADAERTLPRRSPELLAPYEAFLKVLVATGQDEKAFDVLSKIVIVRGKSAEYPKTLVNLTFRAERSFAPVNSVRVEEEAKKIRSEAELSGRGLVAQTAAAGGNAPAVALATSVDGRQFYETLSARGIKMQRVPVRIEVDGSGKALLAEALTADRFLKETAEKTVKDWTFRRYLVDGKPTRIRGYAEVSVLTN